VKVVLFCGGLGMRMREGTSNAPKPMAMIGDRPLLWHVMRYYAHFGHTDFILALGYGAPGKGNTLLNHCGIREDLLEYTVDRSPHKQGMFLPGTHIPIHEPERIAADRPDYVLVLPWNLRTEISAQLSYVRDWGGKLVYPIPALDVEG
jgi:hypothetical protein